MTWIDIILIFCCCYSLNNLATTKAPYYFYFIIFNATKEWCTFSFLFVHYRLFIGKITTTTNNMVNITTSFLSVKEILYKPFNRLMCSETITQDYNKHYCWSRDIQEKSIIVMPFGVEYNSSLTFP